MQLQFAAEHFTNISLNLQDALSDCIPGGGVEGVVMARQMKVGQPPSCGVTGAGRTNVTTGAGLTWNTAANKI